MTDDRDFKRLVRQRMAKTGESYTAARRHLRRGRTAEEFKATVLGRAGVDGLATHLEQQHGIVVRQVSPLDVGVVRVDRRDGPPWVARVFPAARARQAADGDAAILRFLDEREFPAERSATTDPVSEHEGQAVLVTELVEGTNARFDRTEATIRALGDLTGRLHRLPVPDGSAGRAAGSWHHLSIAGGGRAADVRTALSLLDDVEGSAGLRDTVRAIDDGADLPQALVHPDPCGANAMAHAPGEPVLIDWTGAGRGPRLHSLANLLITCPNLSLVEAAVAGYRAHVDLEEQELERLAAALEAFPILLDCWMVVVHGQPVATAVTRAQQHRERAATIAERARRAVEADPAPPRPRKSDSQLSLL